MVLGALEFPVSEHNTIFFQCSGTSARAPNVNTALFRFSNYRVKDIVYIPSLYKLFFFCIVELLRAVKGARAEHNSLKNLFTDRAKNVGCHVTVRPSIRHLRKFTSFQGLVFIRIQTIISLRP